MQYPLPKGGNGAGAPPVGTQETAGALGRGVQFANAFVLLFGPQTESLFESFTDSAVYSPYWHI